jgi:hypothetical protein
MLWMKLGLGGLLLFCYCLLFYVKFGIRNSYANKDMLQIGLFATCAQWFGAMMVGPSWWYYRETCLMALVVALVIQIGRQKGLRAGEINGNLLRGEEARTWPRI